MKKIINLYHKIKFFVKSLKFPKTLLVGNTQNKILAHNWATSMDIFNGSTLVNEGRIFYEPNEYKQFIEIAKGKKIFFDIGAHIGWYCLVANGIGIERSYAFEIIDAFAEVAEKNFRLNNIKGDVFRVALGVPGEVVNFSQSIYHGSGIAVSLDRFCAERGIYPDIVKMDIEGAELDVLRAMKNVLSMRPALDISIHPTYLNERGQKAEEVLALLKGYGYEIVWSDRDTYFMK